MNKRLWNSDVGVDERPSYSEAARLIDGVVFLTNGLGPFSAFFYNLVGKFFEKPSSVVMSALVPERNKTLSSTILRS